LELSDLLLSKIAIDFPIAVNFSGLLFNAGLEIPDLIGSFATKFEAPCSAIGRWADCELRTAKILPVSEVSPIPPVWQREAHRAGRGLP
jgi:hypothetical protein